MKGLEVNSLPENAGDLQPCSVPGCIYSVSQNADSKTEQQESREERFKCEWHLGWGEGDTFVGLGKPYTCSDPGCVLNKAKERHHNVLCEACFRTVTDLHRRTRLWPGGPRPAGPGRFSHGGYAYTCKHCFR